MSSSTIWMWRASSLFAISFLHSLDKKWGEKKNTLVHPPWHSSFWVWVCLVFMCFLLILFHAMNSDTPDQPFVPQRCFHVIMSLCTMSKSSYVAKNLHATQSEHARILTWKKRVAKECNDKPGPFLHRRSLKSPFIQAPRLLHLVHSVGGICMQP